MEGYGTDTYGERFAEVYDDWYGDITDTDACVDAVATLARRVVPAGRGRPPIVLELGVGTGRLALGLALLEIDVRGVDSSPAMLERLAAKDGGAAVATMLADFADCPMPTRADDPPDVAPDVILCAYNTLLNLPDRESQRACLRAAAELVATDGLVVVETFVPPDDDDPAPAADPSAARVRHLSADRVVLSCAVRDPTRQQLSGQYIDITEQGIRLRPWHLHYLHLDQFDDIADDAGLVLDRRWANWHQEPFTPTATTQISILRTGRGSSGGHPDAHNSVS